MSKIFICKNSKALQNIFILCVKTVLFFLQEISTKYEKSKFRLKEKFETKNLDLENEVKFLRIQEYCHE